VGSHSAEEKPFFSNPYRGVKNGHKSTLLWDFLDKSLYRYLRDEERTNTRLKCLEGDFLRDWGEQKQHRKGGDIDPSINRDDLGAPTCRDFLRKGKEGERVDYVFGELHGETS